MNNSNQIFIFWFVIFALVQAITCPPVLDKSTPYNKSNSQPMGNGVPKASTGPTNNQITSQTPKKLPSLRKSSVVEAEKPPEVPKNNKPLRITPLEASSKLSPSAVSRIQPQTSIAPAKIPLKAPVVSSLPKQTNAVSKAPVTTPKLSPTTTTRSLLTPPPKPSGTITRSLSQPVRQKSTTDVPSSISPQSLNKMLSKSQKEQAPSRNVPVVSTRALSKPNEPVKRTPSQKCVSTPSSQYKNDLSGKKRSYDTDDTDDTEEYYEDDSNKVVQKQNSMGLPGVIKRPLSWAWMPAKLAWSLANRVKNSVTGNNGGM